jgi:hypothetical protein
VMVPCCLFSHAQIDSLKQVQRLLENVQTDVAALQGCCDDMEKQLEETKEAAGSLTEKTAELKVFWFAFFLVFETLICVSGDEFRVNERVTR